MNILKRSIAVATLGCGTMIGPSISLLAAAPYQDYGRDYDRGYDHEGLRHLLDRTQEDLRVAAESGNGDHDQRQRYREAQKHFSDLDRHLTKGHFNKDELDHAIADVQGILDHNTLMGSSRNALLQDVTQLREVRARHDSR